MENKELAGRWVKTKGKLKKKYSFLSDNDLLLEAGRKEEMLKRLQDKLGKTREELQKIIAAL